MRSRLNIFLEPDHARRLDQLATMKGVSKSAIVAAALASYLSPDGAIGAKPPSPSGWTGSPISSTGWSATRPS